MYMKLEISPEYCLYYTKYTKCNVAYMYSRPQLVPIWNVLSFVFVFSQNNFFEKMFLNSYTPTLYM